ncbi:MAG: hypothetical protein Q8O91_00920 [Candidatus Aminicenantes bacterium]|nr:hypothetical protein [Candidatus Aminicenantes bacterium]
MNDHIQEMNHDSIERLIDAEVNDSLSKFRSGDFEAHVRSSLRGMTAQKSGRKFETVIFRPFWIAAALVLLAGAMAILILFPKTPRAAMAQAIESVLQQTPGILALENRNLEGSREAESTIPDPIGSRIREALMSGRRDSDSPPLPGEGLTSPGIGRKTRPMTIEETYKILIIDKSIERVFALIS